ncbi:unnamed protein product [Nippostrongylus brasiliensis]|uniref:RdRP_2 domain-containing protein n=1 Tax=Nippostrongylus brasiliensis TaxID=27835 RepID=A0A158R1B1_NIPBR|nr:unnamed protein product [Nippostrongylus brasiliensis]
MILQQQRGGASLRSGTPCSCRSTAAACSIPKDEEIRTPGIVEFVQKVLSAQAALTQPDNVSDAFLPVNVFSQEIQFSRMKSVHESMDVVTALQTFYGLIDLATEIGRYTMMIKWDAKNKLEPHAWEEYLPVRIIFFHKPVINAIYAKSIEKSVRYFYSTFIVETPEGFVAIPDPLKRFERLGRHLFGVDKEGLHDRYISFAELMRVGIEDVLLEGMAERYGNTHSARLALDAIRAVHDNFGTFQQLYKAAEHPRVIRKIKTTLRVLN